MRNLDGLAVAVHWTLQSSAMLSDRVAVVGQAPSRTSDGQRPFSGHSGARLAELAGRELGEWADCFNLFPEYPGRIAGGKGDRFNRTIARERARKMEKNINGYWRTVFVGRNVASAFKFSHGFCEWIPTYLQRADLLFYRAVIPHPSGIVQWWNSKDNVDRARAFLRGASGAGGQMAEMNWGKLDGLELAVDDRLWMLRKLMFEFKDDFNIEMVASLMRAAYGKGYMDALKDDGALCVENGYTLPPHRQR